MSFASPRDTRTLTLAIAGWLQCHQLTMVHTSTSQPDIPVQSSKRILPPQQRTRLDELKDMHLNAYVVIDKILVEHPVGEDSVMEGNYCRPHWGLVSKIESINRGHLVSTWVTGTRGWVAVIGHAVGGTR